MIEVTKLPDDTEQDPDHEGAETGKSAPSRARSSEGRDVPAVRRACAILWFLAKNDGGLSVSRIARELDIIPSTCLHILRELINSRLVSFEPNGKLYRLGHGVLTLATELSRHNVYIQVAQPRINRLSRTYGVSVSATERDGDDIVIVAVATAPEGSVVAVGNRVPCLASASGRLIAAFNEWNGDELRQQFNRIRWNNPPDFELWLEEVRATRTRGYAIDEGYFRRGMTAFAAPMFRKDGTVEHTVSVAVVSAQVDRDRREELIEAVTRTSSEITAALG